MISTNPSAYIKPVFVGKKTAIVAGSGTDASEVTGATIDLSAHAYPQGSQLCLAYTTTLTADKKASITIKTQTSADGTNWDTAVTVIDAATLATGATTAVSGLYKLDTKLSQMKRYVRYLITMDLEAAGTDTAEWYATANLLGGMYLPV